MKADCVTKGLIARTLCLIALLVSLVPLNASDHSDGNTITAYLISELPEHVKARKGELSLYADFEARDEYVVPLYLINDTDADLHGLELISNRETKRADGSWVRCDLVYGNRCMIGEDKISVIPSGSFIKLIVKSDSTEGEEKPVRITFWHGIFPRLVSNIGMGKVDERDIKLCQYDARAMLAAPFSVVKEVALGQVSEMEDAEMFPLGRGYAIEALGRFAHDRESVDVINQLIDYLMATQASVDARNRSVWQRTETEFSTLLDVLDKFDFEVRWNLVSPLLSDDRLVYSEKVIVWLIRHFNQASDNRMMKLIREILSNPKHPAFITAIKHAAEVMKKGEAIKMLKSIVDDSQPESEMKLVAKEAYENLVKNPFLEIEVQAVSSKGRGWPSLNIKVTNISAGEINFPKSRWEDLIEIALIYDNYRTQVQKTKRGQNEGGLKLSSGESIVMTNVKWWEYMGDFSQSADKISQIDISIPMKNWPISAKGNIQFWAPLSNNREE